jgi:hypothetical protein
MISASLAAEIGSLDDRISASMILRFSLASILLTPAPHPRRALHQNRQSH